MLMLRWRTNRHMHARRPIEDQTPALDVVGSSNTNPLAGAEIAFTERGLAYSPRKTFAATLDRIAKQLEPTGEALMRFRTTFSPILILLAVGCASTNRTDAGQMLDFFDHEEPDMVAIRFVVGSGEAGVGGSTCAKHLVEMGTPDPSRRAAATAAAIDSCPSLCVPVARANEWTQLSDGAAITAKVVEICDSIGPDPVFGGELSDQRKQMKATDYLIARMLVAQIWSDLGKDSVEGRKLDALRPKLAKSLVLQNQVVPQ